jgi:hypothetical protein
MKLEEANGGDYKRGKSFGQGKNRVEFFYSLL